MSRHTDADHLVNDTDLLRSVYERVKNGSLPGAAFVKIIDEIDWKTRPAFLFVEAINMALALDGLKIARKLAQLGHEIHPDNERLKRTARIFAPPRVVAIKRPPVKGLSKSMRWLQEHGSLQKKENYWRGISRVLL